MSELEREGGPQGTPTDFLPTAGDTKKRGLCQTVPSGATWRRDTPTGQRPSGNDVARARQVLEARRVRVLKTPELLVGGDKSPPGLLSFLAPAQALEASGAHRDQNTFILLVLRASLQLLPYPPVRLERFDRDKRMAGEPSR